MIALALQQFHQDLGARFMELNGMEVVDHYGDFLAEHAALREAAAFIDLSFRSRLCLAGSDRQKFLHGQVTNNVAGLVRGDGCYAALVTAKGKMQSDLNIYCLANELLLDFEPGLTSVVSARLDKYIIADDVQVVDAAPHYGLLSVQGPKANETIGQLGFGAESSGPPMSFAAVNNPELGEMYLMNQPRVGTRGFDLYAPSAALRAVADRLAAAVKRAGGRCCGWRALEMARVEAGIPRFGIDMDETNLPLEAGLEERAVSYTKGCYIGQEVIARLRTYGQVAKALRGLRLTNQLKTLPVKGDKLFQGNKEVGFITSAVASPAFNANLALGYVRREANQIGSELIVRTATEDSAAQIVALPFGQNFA